MSETIDKMRIRVMLRRLSRIRDVLQGFAYDLEEMGERPLAGHLDSAVDHIDVVIELLEAEL